MWQFCLSPCMPEAKGCRAGPCTPFLGQAPSCQPWRLFSFVSSRPSYWKTLPVRSSRLCCMKSFLWPLYSKDLESNYTTTQVSCCLMSFATDDNSASSNSFASSVFFGSHVLLPARRLAAPALHTVGICLQLHCSNTLSKPLIRTNMCHPFSGIHYEQSQVRHLANWDVQTV